MNSSLVITPTDPTSSAIRELIAELDNYLAERYPRYLLENNHDLDIAVLQDKSVTVFLAEFEREPVGCIAIKRLDPGYAEVKRMYVRPTLRGQGVGRRLLQEIEAFAEQTNIHTLRLKTGIYQPEALKLFERCGFYQIPPFGDYQPDPLCLFFEKVLP
ncbi:MAG: GNAT family N-acetyltransferase [Leptolyngbyaceae cyanobacterium RU_5_1]|nr:GNAT family N-acetyltransferase [Leptolyngbyaceae cyanobacterium RU_5_1]